MSKFPRTPDLEHTVTLSCDCGIKRQFILHHYESVFCKCGKQFLLLQPKRNGPMKLVLVKR